MKGVDVRKLSLAVVGVSLGVLSLAMSLTAEEPRSAQGMETKPAAAGAKGPGAFGLNAPDKRIAYKRVGEKSLYLYLFGTQGPELAGGRPAIVFFHGGAFKYGGAGQFFWQSKYLAGRGMVAINVEYRLLPKEGGKVADCVTDAKSAIRYVRAHAEELGVDPKRIAASGGSAGGDLALAAAIVPGLDEKGEDTAVSCKPNLLVLFNPPLFDPDGQNTLTIEQFSKETPPTQFFYGVGDKAVLKYAKQCLEASRKLGNHVELYTAEGQGHGFFGNPPWREATLRLADEFLAKYGYTKGEPTMEVPGDVKLNEVK